MIAAFRRVILLGLVLALGLAVGGAAVAHAAALALSQAILTTASLNHPCPGSATAGSDDVALASSALVIVSLAGQSCAERPIQVTVLDGGTVVTQGQGVVIGSTAKVTVPTYTPKSGYTVRATVDGWDLVTTWSHVPPVDSPGCAVYRLIDGVETARTGTCTVTGLRLNGAPWGADGSRQANVGIDFRYSEASHPDYFRFTVDMSKATNIPANWNWSTSGTLGNNLLLSPTYRCSSLPTLSGSSVPSWGPTTGFEFQIVENRAGRSNLTCAS